MRKKLYIHVKGVGMSYIDDLDALAAANVIAFDAPAYIRGTEPRYVGNPQLETIPDQLPPMKQQPKKDEFVINNNSDPHNNPVWKKVLFGVLATAGVIASIVLGKNLVKNIKKGTFGKKGFKKLTTNIGKKLKKAYKASIKWIKSIPTKIKNSKLGKTVAGWFKKKPAAATP